MRINLFPSVFEKNLKKKPKLVDYSVSKTLVYSWILWWFLHYYTNS